jgi:transposase InsO family protein
VAREEKLALSGRLYVGLMEDIREMHPGMGLRKMYDQFSPEGIGRDAFICLGLCSGFRLNVVRAAHKTTRGVKNALYGNLLEDREFTGVNQVWVSDLFYFPIADKHYYVVLIMDAYSRRIVGASAADNMRAENNVNALEQALGLRKIDDYEQKLTHHSDKGGQYLSAIYTDLLTSSGICISMCRDVLDNAHSERVNGTIKNEYLARWGVNSYEMLKSHLVKAVDNYNNRLHNSLGMTPIQFEAHTNGLAPQDRPPMRFFVSNNSFPNTKQLEINFDC